MNMEINTHSTHTHVAQHTPRANNKIRNLFLIEFINHIGSEQRHAQGTKQSKAKQSTGYRVANMPRNKLEISCVCARVQFRWKSVGDVFNSIVLLQLGHNFYSICIFANHII